MALSDDEIKETENMKKKRRRIKLPESDSSEDEGEDCCDCSVSGIVSVSLGCCNKNTINRLA